MSASPSDPSPEVEITPEMVEAGIAVDRHYASLPECDERDRIRDIYAAMRKAELACRCD